MKLAVDFHLETDGSKTIVRLVQSGFSDSKDWDDEFNITSARWSYFMEHLRFYVEQKRGLPRDLISFRRPMAMDPHEAFERLIGPAGLSTEATLRHLQPSDRFAATTATGDALSGSVIASRVTTCQFGIKVDELGGAFLFVEIEPHKDGCRPALWLSTYGLGKELEPVRARFERLYESALAPELNVTVGARRR